MIIQEMEPGKVYVRPTSEEAQLNTREGEGFELLRMPPILSSYTPDVSPYGIRRPRGPPRSGQPVAPTVFQNAVSYTHLTLPTILLV